MAAVRFQPAGGASCRLPRGLRVSGRGGDTQTSSSGLPFVSIVTAAKTGGSCRTPRGGGVFSSEPRTPEGEQARRGSRRRRGQAAAAPQQAASTLGGQEGCLCPANGVATPPCRVRDSRCPQEPRLLNCGRRDPQTRGVGTVSGEAATAVAAWLVHRTGPRPADHGRHLLRENALHESEQGEGVAYLEAESAHGDSKKVGASGPFWGPHSVSAVGLRQAACPPRALRSHASAATSRAGRGAQRGANVINTKQVNISVQCQGSSRARVHFQSLLCEAHGARWDGRPGPPSSAPSLCRAPIWPPEPRPHSAMKPKNQSIDRGGRHRRGQGAPTARNPRVLSNTHSPPAHSGHPPAPRRPLRGPLPRGRGAGRGLQGHTDAVVLQLAGQHALVELVEVDQLDQVGELGVPVVQAEEDLPVVLALWRQKVPAVGAVALPAGARRTARQSLGPRLGSAGTLERSAGQAAGWGLGRSEPPPPRGDGHPLGVWGLPPGKTAGRGPPIRYTNTAGVTSRGKVSGKLRVFCGAAGRAPLRSCRTSSSPRGRAARQLFLPSRGPPRASRRQRPAPGLEAAAGRGRRR